MCQKSHPIPERDTSKTGTEQGIFRKFDVCRTDGSDAPGGKHHGCRYFVLDVDHDAYAAAALGAYADACEATHPALACDLREKWGVRIQPAASEAEARVAALEAARMAYASEFPPNADGERDVGSIHANIRALKSRVGASEAGAVPLMPTQVMLEAARLYHHTEYVYDEFQPNKLYAGIWHAMSKVAPPSAPAAALSGYRLAPLDPTPEMRVAAQRIRRKPDQHPDTWSPSYEDIYRAMVESAPAAESAEPVRDYCPEKRKPGGCQLHNLQCGYPKCNQPPKTAGGKHD
ncbi:hypothetical protein [Achromobacter aloeverae]